MPKISDQQRADRRVQILNAAWVCFYRNGVQSTTMEEIIREADLSAGAVYRYFPSKDAIILAAIGASLDELSAALQPLVEDSTLASPAELVGQVVQAIAGFAEHGEFNLIPIGVQGWGEAQRNPEVRRLLDAHYRRFRHALAQRVAIWQAQGRCAAEPAPEAVAQVLLSLILGFVVQSAVLGDADATAHQAALAGWGLVGPSAR